MSSIIPPGFQAKLFPPGEEPQLLKLDDGLTDPKLRDLLKCRYVQLLYFKGLEVWMDEEAQAPWKKPKPQVNILATDLLKGHFVGRYLAGNVLIIHPNIVQ